MRLDFGKQAYICSSLIMQPGDVCVQGATCKEVDFWPSGKAELSCACSPLLCVPEARTSIPSAQTSRST